MGEFTTSGAGLKSPVYEGAATNYRLELKGLVGGDQDSLAAKEINNLLKRSHHICRNNACAITAKKRLISNWIGKGIFVRWYNANKTPNKRMQTAWDIWVKECNLDGYGNLYNTQAGWASALIENGESISRFYIASRKISRIPLAIQNIDSEHLDPLYSDPGKNIRYGIQFDGAMPSVYHLWKDYPHQPKMTTENKRIPVDASDILHIFDRERASQWRGVTMFAPVLLLIYEMDELTDATLQRQKAAQAVSWVIENTNAMGAFAPGSVRATANLNEVDPVTGNRKKVIQGTGGGVQYLEKGESLKFVVVDDIGANLQVMLEDQWSKIASALGLAYHQLTGDLTQVNFSSIRAGLNELRVRVEMIQHHLLLNLGMVPLTNKFKEFAALYVASGFADCYPVFDLPRRYGVDELKDAQADLMEVQAGFATLESKLAERNTIFEEMIEERKKLKSAGIILTSVPDTVPIPPAKDNTTPTPAPTSSNTKSDKQNKSEPK